MPSATRARAELRLSLVRVDKEIESVTIRGDEADELDYLNRLFESVLEVSRRLVSVGSLSGNVRFV